MIAERVGDGGGDEIASLYKVIGGNPTEQRGVRELADHLLPGSDAEVVQMSESKKQRRAKDDPIPTPAASKHQSACAASEYPFFAYRGKDKISPSNQIPTKEITCSFIHTFEWLYQRISSQTTKSKVDRYVNHFNTKGILQRSKNRTNDARSKKKKEKKELSKYEHTMSSFLKSSIRSGPVKRIEICRSGRSKAVSSPRNEGRKPRFMKISSIEA